MASEAESTSQANEHSDNRNLRGARVRHQRSFEACKNVCMYVFIAVQDSLKLAAFNGIPKRAPKEKR